MGKTYCLRLTNNTQIAFLATCMEKEESDAARNMWVHANSSVWLTYNYGEGDAWPVADTDSIGFRFAPYGQVEDVKTFYIGKRYDKLGYAYKITKGNMSETFTELGGTIRDSEVEITIGGSLAVEFDENGKRTQDIQLSVKKVGWPKFSQRAPLIRFANRSPHIATLSAAGRGMQLNPHSSADLNGWDIPEQPQDDNISTLYTAIQVSVFREKDKEPIFNAFVYRKHCTVLQYTVGAELEGRTMIGSSQTDRETHTLEFVGLEYTPQGLVPTENVTVDNAALRLNILQ